MLLSISISVKQTNWNLHVEFLHLELKFHLNVLDSKDFWSSNSLMKDSIMVALISVAVGVESSNSSSFYQKGAAKQTKIYCSKKSGKALKKIQKANNQKALWGVFNVWECLRNASLCKRHEQILRHRYTLCRLRPI